MAKIGFIGLGQMGMPLAVNLARAGHDLVAHDLDPLRRQEAASHGLKCAQSVEEATLDKDFVLTCLPMPKDVELALTGPGGVVEHLAPGTIVIDMSTIDPLTVRRLGQVVHDCQAHLVDAPVTRSVDMAWKGRSALLIGGEDAIVDRCMPLFEVLSDLQTRCGALGNGAAMKLVNNFMAAGILQTVAEALSVGLKSGLTLETIMAATERSGTYNKILLEVLPSRALQGDFSAGFRTGLALKDHQLALKLAEAVGSRLAVGPVIGELFEEVAVSDPLNDFTALLLRQERLDGFEARISSDHDSA